MKAKLCTADPDDWYVYWRNKQGRLIKKRSGINRIKSLPERRAFARELIQVCDQIIKDGIGIIQKPAVQVLRDIVDSKRSGWRHRTWQSYHYAINAFEKYLDDKELKMYEITRYHARGFLDDLISKGMKGKSVNGMRGFLTALFNHYADRNDGYLNPFRGTPKARQDVGKNIAFTEQERTELWGSMDPNLKLFTRFVYFTYIRPIELLRLRVSDIRMDMGQIIIQGHQSKNKRQQAVVIPDVFLPELSIYKGLPPDWYLFGRGLRPGPVSLGRNWVSNAHKSVLTRLKYRSDLTLYSWKHTGVIAAYQAGIDIYAIMRQLRHHSLDMTQIYLKSLGLERNEGFARGMV